MNHVLLGISPCAMAGYTLPQVIVFCFLIVILATVASETLPARTRASFWRTE